MSARARPPPILSDRVRNIRAESFAFIPHRFLRDGFLAALTHEERSLYLFLVLAADRDGVSFYRYDSICSVLEITLEVYIQARNGLVEKDLIAFDGRRFQVLSLPDRPGTKPSRALAPSQMDHLDPASIRAQLLRNLEEE
jgi:hypothetical protein